MRAADVAKETDGRLGHGKHSVLRCHLILVVHRQTDAATHCCELLGNRPMRTTTIRKDGLAWRTGDAVEEGDLGLGVRRDLIVEHVLVVEEAIAQARGVATSIFAGLPSGNAFVVDRCTTPHTHTQDSVTTGMGSRHLATGAIPLMSPPAQKALPPAPFISTKAMCGSFSQCCAFMQHVRIARAASWW